MDNSSLSNELLFSLREVFEADELVSLNKKIDSVVSKYSVSLIKDESLHTGKDFDRVIREFISAKKLDGLSMLTLEGYIIELNYFTRHVDKPIGGMSADDIREFLGSGDWKVGTISKKINVLNSFFMWLEKEGRLMKNPMVNINSPRQPKKMPEYLSIEELERVRGACRTLRQRAILEVMYSTGCRLSEVTSLRIDDIDKRELSAMVTGKGEKDRIVYFSHRSFHHLNEYLDSRDDDCEYLFCTQRKPYRKMGSRALQREITKLNKDANVKINITPHTMRRTLASNLLNNGADLADVQEILGHSDPGTTLIYSRVSESRKKRAHRRFHIQ